MNDPIHLDEITLTDYLDNALDATTRRLVESHLAECAACAAQVAEFRTLFYALEELPPLTLERDLTPAVLAALQTAPAPVAKTRSLAWLLVGQLAVAALLVAALWQWLVPAFAEIQTATRLWATSLDFTPLALQAQLLWESIIAPLQQTRLPTFSDLTGISALPVTTAMAVFIVAAVVWIASNRWLLVSPTTAPSQQG